MRLGVAYNIFDGEELLGYSLKNMRELTDYIVLVYQEQSNFGKWNRNLSPLLLQYQKEGLIDRCYKYTPTFQYDSNKNIINTNGLNNEIEKRNIGLQLCKENKCTHFLNLDCDELYDPTQFQDAKKEIDEVGYDTSFCRMVTYYKQADIMVYPHEDYYAPFIYRIKSNTKFSFDHWNNLYPCKIDPTRRISAGYSRIYDEQELMMHHFAYVRKNMESKITNTSSQVSYEEKCKVLKHWKNFKDIKDDGLFIGGKRHKLKYTTNKFNIEI